MGKLARIAMLAMMLLLMSSLASAIGLFPARTILNFEPNLHHEIRLNIVNTQNKDMVVAVYAKGELAKYVSVPQPIVTISADDPSKELTVSVDLPKELLVPGKHEAELVVVELPKDYVPGEANTMIAATTAVISQLYVNVPYPGKYLEGKIYITEAQVGDEVQFTLSLFNLGEEDIENVDATIRVLGPTNEEIAKVKTNSIPIKAKGEGKIAAYWTADVFQGAYKAEAIVDYDGKRMLLDRDFVIGNLLIEITDIEVKDFTLGEIARFDIHLESRWNEPIPNVFGEITVLDSTGAEMTKFRTSHVDMDAYSTEIIPAYWDTKGVSVGTYNMRLLVHYAGKTTERLFEAAVGLNELKTSFGPTARAVTESGEARRDSLLLIIILMLVLVNIGWFVYMAKFRKK